MENSEIEEKRSECKKFLIIGLMTFLGSFLAFYVLMHQTMLHFFRVHNRIPMINLQSFDKIEKDIEKDVIKKEKNEISKFKNKISAVQTLKYEDAYVIVINLKPFNNDENNIRFSVNGNIVTVSGNVVKNKRDGESAYFFTESFEIPEKIDINDIQKEKIDGKYIITLPIEN